MGFGTLVTNIIMFIAVITLTTAFIGVFKMYVDESATSMKIQSNVISNQMQTDITIQVGSFNNITESITTTITNTGKTKLDLDYIDVYVDSKFIPRDIANRTIGIISSTEVDNPGIWDPKEIIQIVIFTNITRGMHTIKVATEYGVMDSYILSY